MALDGLTLALEGIGRGPQPTAHFGFWPGEALENYGYATLSAALTAHALLSTTMVDDITIGETQTAVAFLIDSESGERADMTITQLYTATLTDALVWTALLDDTGDDE